MLRRCRTVDHCFCLCHIARCARLNLVRARRKFHPRTVRRTDVQNPNPRIRRLHLHRERLAKLRQRHPMHRRHRAVLHRLRLGHIARRTRLDLVWSRCQFHRRVVRRTDVQNPHLRICRLHQHREGLCEQRQRHAVQRRGRAVHHRLRLSLYFVRARCQFHPGPVRQTDVENAHPRIGWLHQHREGLPGILLRGEPNKPDGKQRAQARR